MSSPAPPYGTIHCATLPPPPAHFRSVAHAASGGLLHCLAAGRCGRRRAATRPHLCSCYYQVICCCSSISAPHLWLTYNPPPAPTRIIFSLNAGQMHLHSAFNNINYLNVNSILNFILFTAASHDLCKTATDHIGCSSLREMHSEIYYYKSKSNRKKSIFPAQCYQDRGHV